MVYLSLTKCKALEDSKETDFGHHPVDFALKSGKSCLMWHFLVFIIIIPFFFSVFFSFELAARTSSGFKRNANRHNRHNNKNNNNNGIIKKAENKIK